MKVRLFFAELCWRFHVRRLEKEISCRIFPHINCLADHEYPFRSEAELMKKTIGGSVEAKYYLNLIDRQADAMGKAYGEAFQYLMYRDLNERLRRYVSLVQDRVPAERRIPEYAH
jgi:hypothetical protein